VALTGAPGMPSVLEWAHTTSASDSSCAAAPTADAVDDSGTTATTFDGPYPPPMRFRTASSSLRFSFSCLARLARMARPCISLQHPSIAMRAVSHDTYGAHTHPTHHCWTHALGTAFGPTFLASGAACFTDVVTASTRPWLVRSTPRFDARPASLLWVLFCCLSLPDRWWYILVPTHHAGELADRRGYTISTPARCAARRVLPVWNVRRGRPLPHASNSVWWAPWGRTVLRGQKSSAIGVRNPNARVRSGIPRGKCRQWVGTMVTMQQQAHVVSGAAIVAGATRARPP